MTSSDGFISDDFWVRISSELDAIERDHDVRILLAIESGSRAWRFPSLDSDYDVRFIYIRSIRSYLSIDASRDVIERPLDGVLDLGGWDVRKALQLMVKSNAVLLEWLTSPVRYRAWSPEAADILALANATCDLPALIYHYDRLARSSFENIRDGSAPVRLKTYCYALRAAAALSWLRRHRSPSPMDMPRLMAGIELEEDLKQAIAEIIARKAQATEQDVTDPIPILDDFIAGILAEGVDRQPLSDRAEVRARADQLFASMVLNDPR